MISWLEKNHKFSLAITIVIAIIIFYISSLTFGVGSGKGTGFNAIIYHIIIFFLFTLFLHVSLIMGKYGKFILLVVIIAVLYAISDEIHQLFVPGRTFSLNDIFLDFIGIIFASMIYFISLLYREKI